MSVIIFAALLFAVQTFGQKITVNKIEVPNNDTRYGHSVASSSSFEDREPEAVSKIHYGSGDVYLRFAKETVKFANIEVEGQDFAEALQANPVTTKAHIDGILGLSFKAVAHQKSTPFVYKFDEDKNGELVLGETASENYPNAEVVYTPVTKEVHWNFKLSSHLNYGIMLWGNCASAKDVFLLRILMGCNPREHCRPLFQELGILTVASLFIFTNLVYMFSHYVERDSFSGLHTHDTRNNRDLVVPRHRLAKTSNSHIVMSIKLFNKLPRDIRDSSNINTFKNKKSCDDTDDLPNVQFNIENHPFELSPDDYLYDDGKGNCLTIFGESGTSVRAWVLGGSFLDGMCTIYDMGNHRLGFVKMPNESK
ncbi:hypothetical protein C0J52_00368 [Blattella germanica]|nr:hypothetical protein C0J52_00368 [Blattella germanica]